MEKSNAYYVVRGIVRFVFGVTALLAGWFLIHLLALNVFATLGTLALTIIAVAIHDRKERLAAAAEGRKVVEEEAAAV